MMMKLITVLLALSASFHTSVAAGLRRPSNTSIVDLDDAASSRHRELADYYYTTSDPSVLGKANQLAAIGNPLKGLLTSPRWTGGNTPNDIPSSLEFYYIGLDEVMKGNNKFDWTVLDKTLADAASRNNHVIWRIFVHYPGEPLRLPQYLVNAGVKLVPIADGSVSPQYDDPILLEAFKQFIAAFGKRYDGNKSIGFIQLGLLGYWGEWHTFPDNNLLSTETMDKVVGWYAAAFKTTQLQSRQPLASAFAAGMGLHDDSFAYSTLGNIDWFFMPKLEKTGQTNYWKKGPMGGETRPELQDTIFLPSYKPDSDEYKQDFNKCVDVTHATYMFHHSLFKGGVSGAELTNARNAHARMGYNFQVTTVGVAASSAGQVTVDVTVKQTGVAPFYYPLNLALSCPGTSESVAGVESLIENGSTKVFSFQDIPSESSCLQNIQISLESPFAYAGKKVKFAQGTNGSIVLNLPSPEEKDGDGATTGSEESPTGSSESERFRFFRWVLGLLKR